MLLTHCTRHSEILGEKWMYQGILHIQKQNANQKMLRIPYDYRQPESKCFQNIIILNCNDRLTSVWMTKLLHHVISWTVWWCASPTLRAEKHLEKTLKFFAIFNFWEKRWFFKINIWKKTESLSDSIFELIYKIVA